MKISTGLLLCFFVGTPAHAADVLLQLSPHGWQKIEGDCFEKVQDDQLKPGETLALANTRIQEQIMDSEYVQKLMLPSGARASISTGESAINPGRLITRATLCKKALGEKDV